VTSRVVVVAAAEEGKHWNAGRYEVDFSSCDTVPFKRPVDAGNCMYRTGTQAAGSSDQSSEKVGSPIESGCGLVTIGSRRRPATNSRQNDPDRVTLPRSALLGATDRGAGFEREDETKARRVVPLL